MPQAADHDAASLFDNDNNVEIATTKSDRSRRGSSSEASRPPTSEFKGMFDDAGDSGEEEIDVDDTLPPHVSETYQASKLLKSSHVSFVFILLTLYSVVSLSVLASMMPH